jgi:endonuclease/exonuclease/phosphatase (EEP) superfamily protein YafD
VASGGSSNTSTTGSAAVDLACWATVAIVGAVAVTQAFGWSDSRLLAIAHSLTAYSVVPLVLAIIVAFRRRRLLLVTVGAAAAFGIAVLGTPLAFPERQSPAAPESVGLDVASVNLWYRNDHVDEVADALDEIDADVIVFSEYTPAHQAVLTASPLAARYPHRVERNGDEPTGVAVWSRWPLSDSGILATYHSSHDVTVAGPDGDLRLVAMHMATPFDDLDGWQSDLAIARMIGETTDQPTLLVGDLNSSHWHPDFRQVLDAGFVDANAADGSGFSTSWPTNQSVPAFVRLDHALTTGGLVSTGIDDIDVPGSDHRGLLVSVAPAR